MIFTFIRPIRIHIINQHFVIFYEAPKDTKKISNNKFLCFHFNSSTIEAFNSKFHLFFLLRCY